MRDTNISQLSVSQTNGVLTLEQTIRKILANKTVFDRFLEETTNNVLKNRDKLIRGKGREGIFLTTIGAAYMNNQPIKCKDNGKYIEAQKAYVSSDGDVFLSRGDYEELCSFRYGLHFN